MIEELATDSVYLEEKTSTTGAEVTMQRATFIYKKNCDNLYKSHRSEIIRLVASVGTSIRVFVCKLQSKFTVFCR